MTLDGVQFDGITFKDQLGLLLAGRPRGISEQVGYKLKALLLLRLGHPAGARYTLFGDDVEQDQDSFLLFGEVCAGLRGVALRKRLEAKGVHPRDIDEAVALAAGLASGMPDPVANVFIRQVRGKSRRPETRGCTRRPRSSTTHRRSERSASLAQGRWTRCGPRWSGARGEPAFEAGAGVVPGLLFGACRAHPA